MNYEKIIIEMLDRIKTLEDKVSVLERNTLKFDNFDEKTNSPEIVSSEKSLVQRARDLIVEYKKQAKANGKDSIVLLCNDIQKTLGITQRPRTICVAMYDNMNSNDEVLFAPPSGYSTTLKIKYYL